MKSHITKVYRGGPWSRSMCLSIFFIRISYKLSNYILLVILSYKTINSEHNLFETQQLAKQKKLFKLASHDSLEQNRPSAADYHLTRPLACCFHVQWLWRSSCNQQVRSLNLARTILFLLLVIRFLFIYIHIP